MPVELDLPVAQRWLQEFIISPADTDEEALSSERVAAHYSGDVSQVVTASGTLTSVERAGVYRGMYLQRLQDALDADYPVVHDWLGETQFVRLVTGYVREHPSRSYTLNRLGDRLPDYVASLPKFERQGLLHDLARFELAVTETFDEVEKPALTSEAISEVPESAWETARFKPIAALRLLRFDYPVDRFKQAYRDGLAYPDPVAQKTQLVVYRRDYRVFWLSLPEPAFGLLQALVRGEALGEALERAILEGGAEEEALSGWFQDWLQAGLFHDILSPR